MGRDTHKPVKYHFLTGKTQNERTVFQQKKGINMTVAFAAEPSVLEKSTGYAQQQEDFCESL